MVKKILTIQDISCYGQCSLTVALPIISSYGVEAAILPSAVLSTHTGGFTNFTFKDLTDEMPKIIKHWNDEEIRFDAIYTGYIGNNEQFKIIEDSLEGLSKGTPYLIVDPVMADHGKLYPLFNETTVKNMTSLVKKAKVVIPNTTEASLILNIPYKETYSKEEAMDILIKLSELGPDMAILKGVSLKEGYTGVMSYDKNSQAFNYYETKQLDKSYHGTGDCFASVITAYLVQGKSLDKAVKEATNFVYNSIENTIDDKDHFYGVHFETTLNERRK